jgi:subtilisin family serine protease
VARGLAPPSPDGAWIGIVVVTSAIPAWSDAFSSEARDRLARPTPFGRLPRDDVFGDADGAGVVVAVVDSGVDADHLAVRGRVTRRLRVDVDGEHARVVDDARGADVVGHGTACAGIIAGIAPAAELVSIRVLGADNRGKGRAVAAAVEWAIGEGVSIVNLSLSSRSEAMFGPFHELADRAYFANVLLVCAANNVPGPSYPSLFAAVVSVAAHDVPDPDVWFYNPTPPVEFGAFGVDVDVPWRDGGRIRATGNSFAAPHIAGHAARLRSRHVTATPFDITALLAATANQPG